MSACVSCQAAGWARVTCEPRRSTSRGEASRTPCGVSQASASSISSVVMARPLAASRSIPASATSRAPTSTAAIASDRRGADAEALDPRRRLVDRPHRELVALAEPPLDRRAELLLQVPPHVEERRRPGPAVEVLVRAADREIGAGGGQPGRHRPDGVREVPEHERARVVDQPGDGRQVGERAGAVGHVREDDDGDPVVERRGQHRGVQSLVEVGGDLAHGHARGPRATPATM